MSATSDWVGAIADVASAVGTTGAFLTGGILLWREIRRGRVADAHRVTGWYYQHGPLDGPQCAQWYASRNDRVRLVESFQPAALQGLTFSHGAAMLDNRGDRVVYGASVDVTLPPGRGILVSPDKPGTSCSRHGDDIRLTAHRAVRPGETLTLADIVFETAGGENTRPIVSVQFIDDWGTAWERRGAGRLTRVRA